MDTPEDIKSQRKMAFELGSKYHIDNRRESLGGCAVNVACGLARLGLPVSCYTNIGDDLAGEWIKKELKKEGIDTSLLIEKKNCLSGLSAIIVDQNTGERIIFSNQEANETLEIFPEKIQDADWISATDLSDSWKESLDKIVEVSREKGIKIAFNPRGKNIQDDPEKVAEIAGKCELFFVNKDEAVEIVSACNRQQTADDLNNEEFLLKNLKENGAGVVVITDGTRGAWAYDGEILIHSEAMLQKAVDTTGAGDSFSSAFIAAYVKGSDLKTCVKWGIANSASVVKFYGGVEGLLSEKEMEKINLESINYGTGKIF